VTVLRLLGIGPKPQSTQFKLKLPNVNSFVDLTMTGGGPRGSVCLEGISDRTLTVGSLPGTKIGATGVFSYSNVVGRFRFSAKCVGLKGPNALFALPERVETLQVFSGAAQRNAVRIDATVPAQWRFAPAGRGHGDYVRASLTDISRSGSSLIVDREMKKGTSLELRFALSTAVAPLVLLAEVMRSSAVEGTKKVSLGLRFQGVKPEEDRAIMEFINRRQAERRNRGLA
jgi:hypothetical protein